MVETLIKYFLLLLICSLSSTLAGQAPEPRIGVGLGGIGGFSMEFIDASKTMRGFEGASVDANGYPQNDFRIVVFDMRPCCPWLGSVDDPNSFVPELMAGIYKLSFNGQADVASVGDPVSIENKKYDAVTNTTTLDLIVEENNWLVYLSFTATKRTAAGATNTGITDIRLLRPGYHNRQDDVYRKEFFNAVSHFPVIRFMDFVHTNNANPDFPGTTEWTDRKLPSDALFDDQSPWEYVTELANLTNKDIWVNIPVAASDDYVESLALFLKDNLNPDSKIYIEYSNEVWNQGFTQYDYNMAAAQDEVAIELGGGDATTLNDDVGQCDPDDEGLWGGRRYVKRMKEIGDIFIETFSPGNRNSFNTKIRPVFAWQIGGWIPYYSCILTWFESIYGTGSAETHFYGLAGAAYVNAEGAAANATEAQVHSQMKANSDAGRGKLRDTPSNWLTGEGKIGLRQIADIFGLHMLQYETGPDNGGGSAQNITNRIEANRSNGMKGVLLHDLGQNWFDDGQISGELAMYFVLASSYTRYGSWGATEEVENMHTPKLRAVYELMGIEEDNEGPTFPGSVVAQMHGDDAVVSWDSATDNLELTHYRVADESGALATVLVNEPLTVTLTDYNPANLSGIKVIAFDSFNNPSGYSDIITGVGEENPALVMSISPNPFYHRISVSMERHVTGGNLLITDMLGREVTSKVFDGSLVQIDLSDRDLQQGLYIVSVVTREGMLARKIVRQ